jgi:hypothetical protein
MVLHDILRLVAHFLIVKCFTSTARLSDFVLTKCF